MFLCPWSTILNDSVFSTTVVSLTPTHAFKLALFSLGMTFFHLEKCNLDFSGAMHSKCNNHRQQLTSLTIGFALLHVKSLVPNGSLAGCTFETLNVVGHLQGMHDFLKRGEKGFLKFISALCYNFSSSSSIQWNISLSFLHFDVRDTMKRLLPLWSSFCTWHSLEHIGYRGT